MEEDGEWIDNTPPKDYSNLLPYVAWSVTVLLIVCCIAVVACS